MQIGKKLLDMIFDEFDEQIVSMGRHYMSWRIVIIYSIEILDRESK